MSKPPTSSDARVFRLPTPTPSCAARPKRACACGTVLTVPVEVRFGTSITRTAVALHELHRRAEEFLTLDGRGMEADVMLAIAQAADELIGAWALEVVDEVTIGIGVPLGSATDVTADIGTITQDSVVLIRLGAHTIAAGSVPTDSGSIVTCSAASATESLTQARQVSYGHASPVGNPTRSITVTSEGELITQID